MESQYDTPKAAFRAATDKRYLYNLCYEQNSIVLADEIRAAKMLVAKILLQIAGIILIRL